MSDHLTSLPFDLFEMIVRLAQSNPHTKLLYVSKAFLPFVRPLVFRETIIDSYKKLSTFLELVDLNKAIVPYVVTLEIKLEGHPDVGVPKNKVLKTGFAQLVSTSRVKLEGSSRIAKLLLAPSHDRSLQSMCSLGIQDSLDGFRNPLDPSHYRWLERYNRLLYFELDITRNINETGRRRGSSSNASELTNCRISSLTLRAPCINNPCLLDFISLFPNVTHFSILERTDDGTSCLLPILSQIATPENTTYLGLESFAEADRPEDLSSVLPRFKNFSYLDFGPGTLHNNSFDLLNHTTFPRLEILYFSHGADVSSKQLESLITGDKKLSNLRYVCVDSTKPPTEEMEEMVELADRKGIRLEGDAVELARLEIESRKKDVRGRSDWERKMENLRI